MKKSVHDLGSRGAGARRPSSGVLRAGIAKVDITPDEPVFLGGYSLRKTRTSRVQGRLFVRALVFHDGRRTFAIVMADLIIVDCEALRARIAAATGIPAEGIYVGDTHNHSAPLSRPKPKNAGPGYLGNHGTRWARRIPGAFVQAVRAALQTLQPVQVGAASGSSRIGINRRKRMREVTSEVTFDENHVSQSFGAGKTNRPVPLRELEGVIRLGLNPLGPIDDEVGVLRLDAAGGRPFAVLIAHACHGTSLGGRNDIVCGEWMGRMLSVVEERLGAQPIFLQGAAGDINPRHVGGLDGAKDNLAITEALGAELAAEVVRVYQGVATEVPARTALRMAAANIVLPRAYRELFGDFRRTTLEAPTTAVRIGACTWVNFPGEMFHETGQKVKRAAPTPYAYIAGYTNGNIGYMPTAAAFAEGGYEPAVSRLDPTAEQHYLRQVAELLAQLA